MDLSERTQFSGDKNLKQNYSEIIKKPIGYLLGYYIDHGWHFKIREEENLKYYYYFYFDHIVSIRIEL